MNINVTAATGQLGQKVVKNLLAQAIPENNIIVSVRNTDKAHEIFSDSVEIRHGDYDDAETMKGAFENTDVLMIIPSLSPVEPRIIQHASLIDTAKNAGVQRIVFASFAAAEPTSEFLIAPYMLYAESKTRLSGMEWTILRDGMYLDPVVDWVPDLVEMGRLPYPVKKGRTAYICRDDIARSIAAACSDAKHANRLYSLTGPQAVTMAELAEIISEVTGKTVVFDQITEDDFRDINRHYHVPDYLNEVLVSMYRAVDNGEFGTVTDHVEKLTGSPAESIESYFRRVL